MSKAGKTEPIALRVGRQRATVDRIKSDNEVLKNDLARESRASRMSRKVGSSSDMERMQGEADNYVRKIEMERQQIGKLDVAIATTQKTIIEQKQHMGGLNASKENHEMIAKQIRLLENRLDKALVKFNESLAQNKRLRGKIDGQRRERVVFDGIYKKLEKELHDKKKEMAAIVTDSKQAYAMRDRAQHEMANLKQQAEEDKAEFDSEWRELGQRMEADSKMRQAKRTEAMEASLPAGAQRRLASGGNADSFDLLDLPSMAGSDKAAASGAAGVGRVSPQPELGLSAAQAETYEDAWSKIAEATSAESVGELVDKFLQIEDKNFSLFNYVNQQTTEIEAKEMLISDTKLEIERFKGAGASSDTQRKKLLRQVEDRLLRTESRASEHEAAYALSSKALGGVKTGIHSLFTRLGCGSATVEETLGNQGVTDSNVMQYLGLIEQRVSEVLQMYTSSQAGEDAGVPKSPFASTGMGSTLAAAPPRLSVQPPACEDMGDEDAEGDADDDERPLTRDELKRKTLVRLKASDKSRRSKK